MVVLSCRDSSFSAHTFGAHTVVGESSLFAGGPDGVILVHGYNNSESRLVTDYTPFVAALGCSAVVYSWPGGDHPLDFVSAVGRSSIAGYRLRDVLSMRRMAKPHTMPQLVAHSLGCRVALTALKDGLVEVDDLILMAAAVDWDVFEKGGEFARVPLVCGKIHVLASHNDAVLRMAFPCGDLTGDRHALGLQGPRHVELIPANVVYHDLSALVGDHGDYLIKPECIALLKDLLEVGCG